MSAQDADATPSGTSGLQDLHEEAGLHSPAIGQRFWPERWWRLIDYRIGIIPAPIYVVLAASDDMFAISIHGWEPLGSDWRFWRII